jgi:hypothetical protein
MITIGGEMEEYKKYLIEGDKLQLHITLANYDLEIQGYDGNEIIIEVDDKEKANKRFDIEFENDKLKIEQIHKSWDIIKGGRIILKMPDNKDYFGECKTQSGDMEIRDVGYRGRVYSASGDIELGSFKKETELEVKTTSGDISVQKLNGKIEAHSVSGDIEAKNISLQKLRVKTVSGEFNFSGNLPLKEDAMIKTVSGDIGFDIQETENLAIHIKTVSGEIDIDGSYKRGSKKEVKNYRNLFIKSISGEVEIKLGKETKDVYVETTKFSKSFCFGPGEFFDSSFFKGMSGMGKTMDGMGKMFSKMFSHFPKGVKCTEGDSKDENISRILKMLEEGKISAKEAKELIDSL